MVRGEISPGRTSRRISSTPRLGENQGSSSGMTAWQSEKIKPEETATRALGGTREELPEWLHPIADVIDVFAHDLAGSPVDNNRWLLGFLTQKPETLAELLGVVALPHSKRRGNRRENREKRDHVANMAKRVLATDKKRLRDVLVRVAACAEIALARTSR
jgi:hypothetical protein